MMHKPTIEYRTDPVGMDVVRPRLSWKLPDGGARNVGGAKLEGLPETIVLAPRGAGPAEFDCILSPSGDSPESELVLTGLFEGRTAPADAEVRVKVSGPARLVALDDGDHATNELFDVSSKRLRGGMLQAIIRAGREPGQVEVSFDADGLQPAKLVVALPF